MEKNGFRSAHSTPPALCNCWSLISTCYTGGYSYSSPADLAHLLKISPLRGFINEGTVMLQRFRRYAAALGRNPIVSPSEQSEAKITHQIVSSVLILPLAQTIEINARISNFKNIAKHSYQKICILWDATGIHGYSFKTGSWLKFQIISFQIIIKVIISFYSYSDGLNLLIAEITQSVSLGYSHH